MCSCVTDSVALGLDNLQHALVYSPKEYSSPHKESWSLADCDQAHQLELFGTGPGEWMEAQQQACISFLSHETSVRVLDICQWAQEVGIKSRACKIHLLYTLSF